MNSTRGNEEKNIRRSNADGLKRIKAASAIVKRDIRGYVATLFVIITVVMIITTYIDGFSYGSNVIGSQLVAVLIGFWFGGLIPGLTHIPSLAKNISRTLSIPIFGWIIGAFVGFLLGYWFGWIFMIWDFVRFIRTLRENKENRNENQ